MLHKQYMYSEIILSSNWTKKRVHCHLWSKKHIKVVLCAAAKGELFVQSCMSE